METRNSGNNGTGSKDREVRSQNGNQKFRKQWNRIKNERAFIDVTI